MTDTPLTAEETWARANHETHSADCPVCAALTTRAEQAEANLREKLDELAATRDDLHEWQARVAELEAALKTTADALERLGIDVHDETRAAYALQFARAALEGKR